MRPLFLIKALLITNILLFNCSAVAGSPLWTFTPLTATAVSIANNQTANISYRITNQSSKTHTLTMQPVPGITQVTPAPPTSACSNPFVLSGHASCDLTIVVHGDQLTTNIIGGPIVCQQGSPIQCYRPSAANQLNVTFTGAPSTLTTLSASVTDLALKASGTARTITITNTGSLNAENVVVQSPSWPAGTTDSNTCPSTLPPSSSCTITVTPGVNATSNCNAGTGSEPTPGVVTVSADNASSVSTNVVVLNLGCIYQKGYLFAINDSPLPDTSIGGTTTTLTDVANLNWSNNGVNIITGAQSLTNGTANSALIVSAQGAGNYAAAKCDNYSIDSSGNSPCSSGTCYNNWYLPAVCQMGAAGEQANCPGGLPNMETNLPGLISGCSGAQCLANAYWTSTEFSTNPTPFARTQFYSSGGGSQFNSTKTIDNLVRCARDF